MKSPTQKTKNRGNNAVSRKFGKYSFQKAKTKIQVFLSPRQPIGKRQENVNFGTSFKTMLTRFWVFFTTCPPALTMLWMLTIWTTYLPRFVNVVCEWPLMVKAWNTNQTLGHMPLCSQILVRSLKYINEKQWSGWFLFSFDTWEIVGTLGCIIDEYTRLFGTQETWRKKQTTHRETKVFNKNPPYSFIWPYSFNWHLRLGRKLLKK